MVVSAADVPGAAAPRIRRRRRAFLIVAALALLAVAAAGAAAVWRFSVASRSSGGGGRGGAALEPEVVLPAFTELPAGPRAPRSDGLEAIVGRTKLAEIEALATKRNLACKDTSARALMKTMREKRAKDVDATTSASAKKTSPMEKNPQVRLSCEETHASLLADRARPPSTGRLLFIFDSPSHPLRHVSYRRMHRDEARALADVEDAVRAMSALYGEPAKITGKLPAATAPSFEKFAPFKAEWSWADLHVTVSALSFGERGVDVYEAVEVPWPVRADAPAL